MSFKLGHIFSGVAASLMIASSASYAALLDFTDMDVLNALQKSGSGSNTTYSGTIDNVAFTLSSTAGVLKKHKDRQYDGSSNIGCQSGGGPLKCDKDGLGVDNDEITGYSSTAARETITINFAKAVSISDFYVLDLYQGQRREQAQIILESYNFLLAATASSGDGGFGHLSLPAPLITDKVVFAAPYFSGDDGNNDFAIAGLALTPVPLPAAGWLFLSGLAGLAWVRKKKATTA